MAAIVSGTVEDCDLDSPKKIRKLFRHEFTVQTEKEVKQNNYVLYLSQFAKTQLIAAGINGNTVVLLDPASGLMRETAEINLPKEKPSGEICGVKCSDQNPNELFVCSTRGETLLYDIRTNEIANKFWDSEAGRKPCTTFDVNCIGRVLCMGTEEVKTDVFLSFFDIRKNKMIGGYWESHEKEISQVKFHPTNPNYMISGALDGLINFFDISESSEDDALQATFNVERSVATLNWHKGDVFSCITESDELMFYDLKEIELIQEFTQTTVTERMRRNCSMECGLINCHNLGGGGGEDQIALMATSNFDDGNCLRTLTYDAAAKSLQPHGNFTGNRQVVRCSYYNDTDNYFITGGERGLVSLWRPSSLSLDAGEDVAEEQIHSAAAIGKVKKEKKGHKKKPY